MNTKHSSVERVRQALSRLKIKTEIKELPESTRTAHDAARAVGCDVKQIAKSLIFKMTDSDQPVLIITSGANRVHEGNVGALIGEHIEVANADFVRQQTGFAIGGVAPLGLKKDLPTYIDQDLLACDQIWAAAGSPHAVFRITPDELQRATGGEIISVK